MCDCSHVAGTQTGRTFQRLVGMGADYALPKMGRFGAMAESGFTGLKHWTGFGDYDIKANSLVNTSGASGGQPSIESRGRGVVIRYREYLGDVAVSSSAVGAFKTTSYTVNPGNPITFPWLAPIAGQYDQYKPYGLIFEFKSTASDNSTTSSMGSIIMASDYDTTDNVYTSKAEMLQSAYSSEAKMSDNMLHGLECAPSELQRSIFYTRNQINTATVSGDKDFDVCRTTIATQGGSLAVGTIIGSLYVHYEFELFKEQNSTGLPALQFAFSQTNQGATGNGVDARFLSPFAPFSRTSTTDLGIVIDDVNNAMRFPANLAGSLIRIKFTWASFSNQVGNGGMTPFIYSGCSPVVSPSREDSTYSSDKTYRTDPAYNSAGLSTRSLSMNTLVLLDAVLGSAAAIVWSGTGINVFPPVTAAFQQKFTIECTLMPKNWLTL
jgi:hypothetical protein